MNKSNQRLFFLKTRQIKVASNSIGKITLGKETKTRKQKVNEKMYGYFNRLTEGIVPGEKKDKTTKGKSQEKN